MQFYRQFSGGFAGRARQLNPTSRQMRCVWRRRLIIRLLLSQRVLDRPQSCEP